MSERLVAALKTVFDFRSSRTWRAALGFYLFYLVAGSIVAIALTMIAWAISGVHDPEQVKKSSKFIAGIFCALYTMGLYSWILYQKGLWKEPMPLVGLVLTPILSVAGSIFGLIPVAFLIVLEPEWRRGDKVGR